MAIKKLNLDNIYKVYRIPTSELEAKIRSNLEEAIGSNVLAHVKINADNNYVTMYIEYRSDIVRTQTNSILKSLDLDVVSNTSTVKIPQKVKDALVNAGFIDPKYEILANELNNGNICVYLNTTLTIEALLPNSEDGTQYINWRMVNDKNQRNRSFIEIAMAKNEYINEVRQIVNNMNKKKNKNKNNNKNNNRHRNNRQRR